MSAAKELLDDPQVSCPTNALPGAGHVQSIGDHLLADPEPGSGIRDRATTAGDRQGGVLGHKQCAREPLGFILNVLIPQAAATVIESWAWLVQKEGMAKLVSDIADLPARRVRIVVHDVSPSPIENGHR
jgi:hypothetical protein